MTEKLITHEGEEICKKRLFSSSANIYNNVKKGSETTNKTERLDLLIEERRERMQVNHDDQDNVVSKGNQVLTI